MNEGRAKLAVYVDLDSTPGGMYTAESARNVVRGVLSRVLENYKPMVAIEAFDKSVQHIGREDGLHRFLNELELARETLQDDLDSFQPCKETLDRVLELIDVITEFRNI